MQINGRENFLNRNYFRFILVVLVYLIGMLILLSCAPTKVKIYPRETRSEKTPPTKSFPEKTSPENYGKAGRTNWKLYVKTNEASYSFDAESITHPSEDIINVSVKLHFTNSGILEMVKDFGERYRNLSDEIDTYEIDCLRETFRVLSVTYYSMNGEVILMVSRDEAKWTSIPSNSTSESLYKTLCK
jgi:hypothetical protein